MDAHGLFYDLPPLVYDGHVWGIKPIASHLRIVPDFCHYRGLLVMAGDQTDNAVGQPQSGLWFGAMDDLHQMGKPTGWGGPWWHAKVDGGAPSDPFLMTGFDQKVLHLINEGAAPVTFTVEVDVLGNGAWQSYQRLHVGSRQYAFHTFPPGYSAHWVRITADRPTTATAQFFYD